MSQPEPETEIRRRPEPLAVRTPESLGPAVELGNGEIRYGDTAMPTVVIPPPRPAEERERERAIQRDGCDRCAEIPAELITALATALQAARQGGRRR